MNPNFTPIHIRNVKFWKFCQPLVLLFLSFWGHADWDFPVPEVFCKERPYLTNVKSFLHLVLLEVFMAKEFCHISTDDGISSREIMDHIFNSSEFLVCHSTFNVLKDCSSDLIVFQVLFWLNIELFSSRPKVVPLSMCMSTVCQTRVNRPYWSDNVMATGALRASLR